MAVDPNLDPPLSWKERLVGKGFVESKNGNVVASLGVEDYFDFEDGDIKRSFVNGIPLIVFSERVQHLLVKDMADTILWDIEAMVGKVTKLDFKTDVGVRGHFAAVYVNLDKILVSQVWISGILQRVEYEHFPPACFLCGYYRHVKDLCPKKETTPRVDGKGSSDSGEASGADAVMLDDDRMDEGGAYGPWMIIERRQRRNPWDSQRNGYVNLGIKIGESSFNILATVNETTVGHADSSKKSGASDGARGSRLVEGVRTHGMRAHGAQGCEAQNESSAYQVCTPEL
ncbi:hypothetical protein Gohar_015685, partial [Gossypium harknessii]|nr:hypothetical protein [Gossypium harknessii]